ncbi:uncharacterized protein LOC110381735 [Helicoverpa armigera]|uniref:Uncharacterized protein n=1 Tax=Helicoverpa armigera TaxID=29058 RepID=A0A2W1BEW2_HELAM|nr:hypothetical protein B5X24_HaOG211671 [Helicoverpa armigera]
MFFKYAIFFCVLLIIVDTNARVKREVSPPVTTSPVAINVEALKKNMEAFKKCIDESLATAVGGVNEQHLQPLFNVIGDNLNRFSRAFEVLTAPKPNDTNA